jgi:hypothetical protein
MGLIYWHSSSTLGFLIVIVVPEDDGVLKISANLV